MARFFVLGFLSWLVGSRSSHSAQHGGRIAVAVVFLIALAHCARAAPPGQSFFGNSYPGRIWVQNSIEALAVAEDGTIFTNSSWDEAGREAGIYRDGRPVGMLEGLHGWGRRGGGAITLACDCVFVAMSQAGGFKHPEEDYPPRGEKWFGVTRYKTDGSVSPWPEGRGYAGAMIILSTQHPVTGMTRFGASIAVAVAGEDAIFLLDPDTMRQVDRWTIRSPGKLAQWGTTLWCLPSGGGGPIEIGPTGTPTGRTIADPPQAAAIAASSQYLFVADGGASQQILVFDADLGKVRELGVAGGVCAEPRGAYGEGRFGGVSALSVDPRNGHLIVAENGGPSAFEVGNGVFLGAYNPDGTRLWQIHGLEFLDRGDIDPGDESLIISKDTLYRIEGSIEEQGPVARPVASTLDSFRFPQDPRLHIQLCSADVVRAHGQMLMGLIGQRATTLALYRFDGNTAVPTAVFGQRGGQGLAGFPPGSRKDIPFRWQDTDGDGAFHESEFLPFDVGEGWAWHVTDNGDIWFGDHGGTILHFPLEGFDKTCVPRWAREPATYRVPAGLFTEVNRIEVDNETLYIGGYSGTDPKPHGDWGLIGTRLVRIDGFPNHPHVVWNIRLPYDGSEVARDNRKLPKAMDIEDGLVFVGYVTGAEIEVFDAASGRPLTTLRPGPAVDSLSGWLDIPFAVRAHRRTSGEWLVIAEEVWRGKNLLYQLEDPR
jgi:hypothetical protein